MNPPDAPPCPAAPSKLAGRLWILAAALMWSSGGMFVKAGVFDDWSPEVQGSLLAFWRALFAGLVLAPMIRRPRWNISLVPLTACFVVMSLTYLAALTRTTAANTIWLQATAPWWVFLLSVLLFREPVARRESIPLLFGLLGVGTILFFEIQGQAKLGVICGLASGITYASVVLLMRKLRHENPVWLVALCHLTTAATILPWVLYLGVWPSPGQLAVLVGFGAIQMAIPYVFLVRGLRHVSGQEAVAIGLLEPVLMPLWVFLLGWETPRWWTVAGAALILVGLVLRYVVWELLVPERAGPE